MLRDTLSTMHPQQKPGEVINLGKQSAPGAGEAPKTYTKLSEVPEAERLELRKITAPNICACSKRSTA